MTTHAITSCDLVIKSIINLSKKDFIFLVSSLITLLYKSKFPEITPNAISKKMIKNNYYSCGDYYFIIIYHDPDDTSKTIKPAVVPKSVKTGDLRQQNLVIFSNATLEKTDLFYNTYKPSESTAPEIYSADMIFDIITSHPDFDSMLDILNNRGLLRYFKAETNNYNINKNLTALFSDLQKRTISTSISEFNENEIEPDTLEKIKINVSEAQVAAFIHHIVALYPYILRIPNFIKIYSLGDTFWIKRQILFIQDEYSKLRGSQSDPSIPINDLQILREVALKLVDPRLHHDTELISAALSFVLYFFEFCSIGKRPGPRQQILIFDQ